MIIQLKTTLYDHQQKAVCKAVSLSAFALFMDMGTGKTRTAIEVAYVHQMNIDKVVWFCPVSLKETIRQEIVKHIYSADVYVFDDTTCIRTVPMASWCIIGIESMSSSDRVVLTANHIITNMSFVIIDESAYIKGHNSNRTLRITKVAESAKYRAILTGTPISQGVVDLYAQMRFLDPAILGYSSFFSFAANHLEYSEKYPSVIVRAHNVPYLTSKIEPYVYQVQKGDCLDLPPKLFDVRYFAMTREQRLAYDQAKWDFLSLPDWDIDSYAIFQLFGSLQRIVSGHWQGRSLDCIRLDTLLNLTASVDDKAIIWCKYRDSVRQVAEALDDAAVFYGDLRPAEREIELKRWREDARFLIATASCGGHGLTLCEAHTAIFYENSFQYATRLQAEDRIHRIGQTMSCTYVDIVCSDSIDEHIMESLRKKAGIAYEFRRCVQEAREDPDLIKEWITAL